MDRRQFGLSLCGAHLSSPLSSLLGSSTGSGPWSEPAVVNKVYLAAKEVHWPSPSFDVNKEVATVEARLSEVERGHPGAIRFTGGQILRESTDIEPWVKSLTGADAVLMMPLSAPMVSQVTAIDAARLPVLYFIRPYLGHSWAGTGALRKTGRRVDLIASSSFGDLDAYAPIFRTIRHLKKSKVLVVTDRPSFWYAEPAKRFQAHFGTEMQYMKLADLKPVFESGDINEARRQADVLIGNALRVVEPSRKEIDDAMRFYLGLRALLEKEKANAITIDCFPAVVERTLPSYPCIAWAMLNDAGLYGVCQVDVRATMTQLLITSYSGMPGFVANPLFDTSKNEVIHSHCVAATRMLGYHAPPAPYLVRSHLETAEGAVLQVILPSARTVTVAQFSDAKRLLVSTAEVTGSTSEVHGSPDAEYGCRTKMTTRVADADKWVQNYETGVHRVVFYGDYTRGIDRMGRLMGFEVVKEG